MARMVGALYGYTLTETVVVAVLPRLSATVTVNVLVPELPRMPVRFVVLAPVELTDGPTNVIEAMDAPVPGVALTLRSAQEKPWVKTPHPLTVAFAL